MVRIVIDCYDTDDMIGVKEVLMMALEHLGKVKIINITDGKKELKL